MKQRTLTKILLYSVFAALFIIGCNDDDKKSCTLTSVTGVTDNGSFTNSYTYNNGKLTKQVSTYTGSVNGTIEGTFTYDTEGRISEMTTSSTKTKYIYNSGDPIKSETYYGSMLIERIEYEYENGRIIKSQLYESSGGSLVKSDYNTYDYPNATEKAASKITSYDQNGSVYSVSEYEYDTKKVKIPRGLEPLYKLSVVDGNGIEHNVTKETYTSGTIVLITTYTYQYNNEGYVTQSTETTAQGPNTDVTTTNYNYNCN